MAFIPRGREELEVIKESDVLEFPLLAPPTPNESPHAFSNESWETLPVQNTQQALTDQLVQPAINLGLRRQQKKEGHELVLPVEKF